MKTKASPDQLMERGYSANDLRAIWDFCRHDFERLLELMAWLETLDYCKFNEQIRAAKDLARTRKAAGL